MRRSTAACAPNFIGFFDNAVLTAKWERTFERDPRLADAVSDMESLLATYRFEQRPHEREADEGFIRRAVDLDIRF